MIADRMNAVAATELTRDEVLRYSRHLLAAGGGRRGAAAPQGRARAVRRRRRTGIARGDVPRGGRGRDARPGRCGRGGRQQPAAPDHSRDLGRRAIEDRTRRAIACARSTRTSRSKRTPARLDERNALALVSAYDVIVDGTDNFPTRYLVNDACVMARRPECLRKHLEIRGSGVDVRARPMVRAIAACIPSRRRRVDPELRRRRRAWRVARNHRDDSGHRDRQADSRDRRAAHRPVPHLRRAADAIPRHRAAKRS